MRILLLADINAEHIEKWACSLSAKGIDIGIFSFNRAHYDWYSNNKKIKVLYQPDKISDHVSSFQKLLYVFYLPRLKKAIKEFAPDILHAHSASSYGMLGGLSGFHPFVISVWGSDVYEFPGKFFGNEALLKKNLASADTILSTSFSMKERAKKFTSSDISVIPFGVDLNEFRTRPVDSIFESGTFVIGTIKALEEIYGINYLIEAFSNLKNKYPQKKIKLLIVGAGSMETEYKELANKLNVQNNIVFTGRVQHSEVPKYHNMIDAYVALSKNESFGVSLVEAMACGKPSVVTAVSGFKEIVGDSKCAEFVEVDSSEDAVRGIEKLFLDNELRVTMGQNARKRVELLYDWNKNVEQMIDVYIKVKQGENN